MACSAWEWAPQWLVFDGGFEKQPYLHTDGEVPSAIYNHILIVNVKLLHKSEQSGLVKTCPDGIAGHQPTNAVKQLHSLDGTLFLQNVVLVIQP